MRRSTALTAAATIALGGVALATPAFADEADEQDAGLENSVPSYPVEQSAAAAEAAGVVGWGTGANGEDIVYVVDKDAADEDAVKAFAAGAFTGQAEPVIVELGAEPQAWAEGDVVGGQGYLTTASDWDYACSFGFSAWSPTGEPVMLGAGHCAEDMVNTTLSIPSQEPAVGGPGWQHPASPEVFGDFGFSQFGGPGNSEGYDNTVPLEDQNFTDITVIEVNDGFTPLPLVTDWTTAGDDLYSLAGSGVEVTSVGNPVAGAVSKSGRTTGFTTGAITLTDDPDTTHVLDGFANIDGHIVRGFSSDVLAGPGDSGGSVIQGNTAVGVISGGVGADDNPDGVQWTWSTLLTDALTYIDGYEVALFVEAPVVASPENGSTVYPGATITVNAPGAAELEVVRDGSTSTVAVSDGVATFPAPSELGAHAYSITSVNGYDRSETVSYEITVEAAPIEAPVLTSPENGAEYTSPITSANGTGVAGATVTVAVDGAAVGTATVDADGNWVVEGLDLGYGDFTIVATQELDGETSPEASASFSVAPAAPAVTNPVNGATFEIADFPITFEGTGIPGAEVALELSEFGTATATVLEDGTWSYASPTAEQIVEGDYTLTVTQTIDGITSAATSVVFAVVTEDGDDAADGTDGAADGEADGSADGTDGETDGEGDDQLPATGADSFITLTAAAGGVVLLAGGITLLTLRRRAALIQE